VRQKARLPLPLSTFYFLLLSIFARLGGRESFVQAGYQAGQHAGELGESGLEFIMAGRFHQALPGGDLKQWDALLHAAAGNAEEVSPVWLREAAVAFGDVGGDGDSRSVKLVGEEEVAAGEGFGQRADGVGERNGFLVDDQLFEGEGHERQDNRRK
jgi:hypothetical protein